MTSLIRLLVGATLLFGWSSHVFTLGSTEPPPPIDWRAPHVPAQLLAKLTQHDPSDVAARLETAGAHVLRATPSLGLALIAFPEGRVLSEAAAHLIALGAAEWVEPNYLLAPDLIPNDPGYATYQKSYLDRLEMPGAWDLARGRPEVVVAVLDTGFDLGHEDLAGAVWVNGGEIPGNGVDDEGNGFADDVNGWDFAAGDNDLLPGSASCDGHGTHVAGIVAARLDNSIGIAGIAGQGALMLVDVFDGCTGTYEQLIRAIIYAADNGARIINLSLGATSYSLGEEMAVDYAWEHGAIVVASAGNTGRETVHFPAAHANAIAVAATTAGDALAGFSTRGDFVDVAAPGDRVYSTYPGNRYTVMSGTSMAAPHVSGLAALILARNPTRTPAQVRSLIEDNADDLGPLGWDPGYGHGRVNALRSLARTVPSDDPVLAGMPRPPLDIWPDGCVELIPDGSFEEGAGGWQVAGDAVIDSSNPYSGTLALHFPGYPGASAVVTRTLTLPAFPLDGVLWFAYRIVNQDQGLGVSPAWPYDDWLSVEFRAQDGSSLGTLLRTGNSADTASSGLAWDSYLYRMRIADFTLLRPERNVNLVFMAANDGDNLPTDFWIDEARFCVKGGFGQILMWVLKSASLSP